MDKIALMVMAALVGVAVGAGLHAADNPATSTADLPTPRSVTVVEGAGPDTASTLDCSGSPQRCDGTITVSGATAYLHSVHLEMVPAIETAWVSSILALPGWASCLDGVSFGEIRPEDWRDKVAGTYIRDTGTILYFDTFTSLDHYKTGSGTGIFLHEIGHHLDTSCDIGDDSAIGEAFLAAMGYPDGTGWRDSDARPADDAGGIDEYPKPLEMFAEAYRNWVSRRLSDMYKTHEQGSVAAYEYFDVLAATSPGELAGLSPADIASLFAAPAAQTAADTPDLPRFRVHPLVGWTEAIAEAVDAYAFELSLCPNIINVEPGSDALTSDVTASRPPTGQITVVVPGEQRPGLGSVSAETLELDIEGLIRRAALGCLDTIYPDGYDHIEASPTPGSGVTFGRYGDPLGAFDVSPLFEAGVAATMRDASEAASETIPGLGACAGSVSIGYETASWDAKSRLMLVGPYDTVTVPVSGQVSAGHARNAVEWALFESCLLRNAGMRMTLSHSRKLAVALAASDRHRVSLSEVDGWGEFAAALEAIDWDGSWSW